MTTTVKTIKLETNPEYVKFLQFELKRAKELKRFQEATVYSLEQSPPLEEKVPGKLLEESRQIVLNTAFTLRYLEHRVKYPETLEGEFDNFQPEEA